MSKNKVYKCHHCGEKILDDRELVIKPVPLATKAGVRNYKRKFHMDCMKDFVDTLESREVRLEENSWWDKCYQKAKQWLDLKEGQNLDEHFVMRLKGLRVGKFLPNGDNTHIVKRGYDFETIYRTMQLSEAAVKRALSERNFSDQQHKINYIMKIVVKNVNFVYSKMSKKRKTEEQLNKDSESINQNLEVRTSKYIRKSDEKAKSKVSELIDKDIEDTSDDMNELFN